MARKKKKYPRMITVFVPDDVRRLQMDLDMISALITQDIDLGCTVEATKLDLMPDESTDQKIQEEDPIKLEKLKASKKAESGDDKNAEEQDESKNQDPKPEDPNDWSHFPYPIDGETGEYLTNLADGWPELSAENRKEQPSESQQEELTAEPSTSSSTPEQSIGSYPSSSLSSSSPSEAGVSSALAVGPSAASSAADCDDDIGERPLLIGADHLVGLVDDSLSLSLSGDDFASQLLNADSLLGSCDEVGLLNNDSLGLTDTFNLEEALLGLHSVEDEEEIQKKDITKKKSSNKRRSSCSVDSFEEKKPCTEPDKPCKKNGNLAKKDISKSDKETKKSEEKASDDSNMIHTPQYHPHPHRGFHQARLSYPRAQQMDQRWPEVTPFYSQSTNHGNNEHYSHHLSHHVTSQVYEPVNVTHHGYDHIGAARNVILNNATLAPPVGDLNSTGSYHNAGFDVTGASNLGSAVATSMNLTNSSEPMGAESNTNYKAEPTDLMYYQNNGTHNVSMNQNPDSSMFSNLLDDPINWNNEDLNFNMTDGIYAGSNNSHNLHNGSNAPLAMSNPAANVQGPSINAHGQVPTEERLDSSSDSAVSSMGSERVPSVSDGEWMETNSNSSHTQADVHFSMDYHGKYNRLPYECNYQLGHQSRRSCSTTAMSAAAAAAAATAADRGTSPAQKKHHLFGKRCLQEQGGMPNSPMVGQHPAPPASIMKYDYESVAAAGPPQQAFAGPIEGATGPELKYPCNGDFGLGGSARNAHSSRTSLDHIQHNHTYTLPPENTGTLQRPLSRDKKRSKSEGDEHLTRDEKKARALNVPIAVHDIINLPMDEFNERLSKYDLSESQLSLIRDIRRRGKNKVAAQNCRKRKLDQINSLSDEVKEMRTRKSRLISDRNCILSQMSSAKERFSTLYRHIFTNLRDQDGNPYDTSDYSLQLSADGNNVVMVPRTRQVPTQHPAPSNVHYPQTSMEHHKPQTKENSHNMHQMHHSHHHNHTDHREE
ncbi:segmentation protein cap'n'collar isoform X4 [Trichogramma pretiosum]|uniref:segmentation protein cap'n'collar isoform X4 n=1 Tax=Trichogramma pretiosum TaxID=7493 RepID=UPI000C71B21B|nr:segmentation protein cap'n'collar isoform X4 [Trichogramma pretiosum]